MSKAKPRKHADGSLCPEGTQRLPIRFVPCCPEFTARTFACCYDIRYEWWSQHKGWFIVIAESAGSGGIAISFCPHCGSKLSGGKKSGRFIEV